MWPHYVNTAFPESSVFLQRWAEGDSPAQETSRCQGSTRAWRTSSSIHQCCAVTCWWHCSTQHNPAQSVTEPISQTRKLRRWQGIAQGYPTARHASGKRQKLWKHTKNWGVSQVLTALAAKQIPLRWVEPNAPWRPSEAAGKASKAPSQPGKGRPNRGPNLSPCLASPAASALLEPAWSWLYRAALRLVLL